MANCHTRDRGGAARWLMGCVDTATAGLVNQAVWDGRQVSAAALTDKGHNAKPCSRPAPSDFGLMSVYKRKKKKLSNNSNSNN